jgi:hypothetical protein
MSKLPASQRYLEANPLYLAERLGENCDYSVLKLVPPRGSGWVAGASRSFLARQMELLD